MVGLYSGGESRGRTLDSSEYLISGNCKVRVREVHLIKSEERFGMLDSAIDYARGLDYVIGALSVVNVVHGSPENNEPRPALTCLSRRGIPTDVNEKHVGDAIIIYDPNSQEYHFYKLVEGFQYVP